MRSPRCDPRSLDYLDERVLLTPHGCRMQARDLERLRYPQDVAPTNDCRVHDTLELQVREIAADYDLAGSRSTEQKMNVADVAEGSGGRWELRIDESDRAECSAVCKGRTLQGGAALARRSDK